MSEPILNDRSPVQQLLHRELVEGLSRLLQKASDNQDAIVGGEIDELTREFHLITKSGERQYVGIIAPKGEVGDDGVSIIDVQLVEDPEQPGRVFFETELSNGLILQTRNSIEGYHGKSVEAASVVNDTIVFTLEGGVSLEPIPVSGLTPISISGARINPEREVIVSLTDGTEFELGLASDLKGVGIAEVYRENGKLYVKYDEEGNGKVTDLGRLVGLRSMSIVDGNLEYVNDNSETNTIGPLTMVTRGAVEENHLILYTNQSEDGDNYRWDLGPVENLRGDDGIDGIDGLDGADGADGLSIAKMAVEDNIIKVTLSDDSTLPEIPVTGLRPIHVIGAAYIEEESELFFTLSNGDKISSGIGADFKGVGVEDIVFNAETGEITLQYSDEEEPTVIGTIPTLTGFSVSEIGEIQVTWSHLLEPMTVGNMRSIQGIDRTEQGIIQVTFNDEEIVELGSIKSIEEISIDGDNLLIRLTGEEPLIVGSLRGEQGVPGRSISTAGVNDTGNLILSYDDGEEQDVGYVRTTIQNFLGQTKSFKWSEGPEFPAAHIGNVIVFIGDEVVPMSDLDLNVGDVVKYTGDATHEDETSVTILSFIMAPVDETSRGVFEIKAVSDTAYQISLEDGTLFTLETETPIDLEALPPGIADAAIDPTTSVLTITKTDGEVINVGKVNSSDNTETVYISDKGELHVVLNSGLDLNAGSVVSNMTIDDVSIDPDGNLLVYLKGASEPFNAGPTANYVTDSFIDDNDRLIIQTSDGREIDAGVVRSPLLGTIYEFTGTAGQTRFRLDHSEFKVDVSLQGIGLFDDQIILTNPQYVELVNPIVRDGQRLRVVLYSRGTFKVTGLDSAKDAPPDTYYGIDTDGNEGFHPKFSKLAGMPLDLAVRNNGSTELSHANSGLIDVFVNGKLLHEGYRNNDDNTKLIFDEPLDTTDKIRVVDYSRPQVANGLLAANYGRVIYQTLSPGGTFSAGDWRVRSVNAILDNQINVDVRNNRIILQPGIYYVKGYATCKGVGQNVLKLYDQTNQMDLLVGGAQFSPLTTGRPYQQADDKTEISGYFEVTSLTAVILMHKGTISSSAYGFGSGNPNGGAPGRFTTSFNVPGRLVDLEFWRM